MAGEGFAAPGDADTLLKHVLGGGSVAEAPKTLEGWALVRTMLDDLAGQVQADAETELELVEGIRVLARTTALCAELSLDVDPEKPWFFPMNTEVRYLGGPNPDGEYHLAMIDGRRGYRVRGSRGSAAYLGFQVLAGVGLTPRRQAVYVSDTELELDAYGSFDLVLRATRPEGSDSGQWVEIPEDASAIIVRQYIGDRGVEVPAELQIDPLEPPGPVPLPTDDQVGDQLTSMAWTIVKLATLHKTIKPELLTMPNVLVSAEAAALGSADTTPDNLYLLGTFRLEPTQALVVDFVPPESRYWSATLENIWHECLEPRRRRSSITNVHAEEKDGRVRLVISGRDPGVPNWLDTGGRHRGFVILRWLDGAAAPELMTEVVEL
ncbi:MAG: hypothetical protein JWO27_1772 [Frankiales bacterium]|nr:hypothetical protein [Frankiales bacterium]